MAHSPKSSDYTRRELLKYGRIGAATLGTLPTGIVSAQPGSGIERTLIPADPDAGFHFPYYLYAPNTVNNKKRPLLVNPNHSTTNPDDTPEERRERDIERAEGSIRAGTPRHIADDLNVPLLIPVFSVPFTDQYYPIDEEETRLRSFGYTVHSLSPAAMHITDGPWKRVDLQLIRMVEHATELLRDKSYPVTDADKFILNGFSSAGDFVNRFTAFHPTRVRSVTAGGINGTVILPISEAKGHTLNYKIGIANFESIIGRPFDLDAFTTVPQYIYMGGDDGNDTLTGFGKWDPDGVEIVLDVYGEDIHNERFRYSRSIYEEVGANAEFRMYGGVGHTITDQMHENVVEFHEQQIGTAHSEIDVKYVIERLTGREITNTIIGGVAAVIAGLGGLGYALKQRMGQRGE